MLRSEFHPPSHRWILVASLSLVALMGAIDFYVGNEISVSIFYLLPVHVATWYAGPGLGLVISVLGAVLWFVADLNGAAVTSIDSLVLAWNFGVRVLYFAGAAFLLSQLKARLESEASLSRSDPLTRVANRRHFYEVVETEISRARRYSHPLTLAYIDLDDFKHINDRFGHQTGDSLLQLVAGTLQAKLRRPELVARLGGDEFAILLPETGSEAAQAALVRMREMLRDLMQEKGWPVTFSIGAITYELPPESVDQIVRQADTLMYHAKHEGKDMVRHLLVRS
jgi:diguanylate cyclase (GGDEF)-like protein